MRDQPGDNDWFVHEDKRVEAAAHETETRDVSGIRVREDVEDKFERETREMGFRIRGAFLIKLDRDGRKEGGGRYAALLGWDFLRKSLRARSTARRIRSPVLDAVMVARRAEVSLNISAGGALGAGAGKGGGWGGRCGEGCMLWQAGLGFCARWSGGLDNALRVGRGLVKATRELGGKDAGARWVNARRGFGGLGIGIVG